MPTMMVEHFRTFAHYNRWANDLLYAAAGTLSDADYRADRGAFFRSLHGTLNHILVCDRIWLQRITGEGTAPARLDDILFEDLAPLRAARTAEDLRIVDHVDGLDEQRLQGDLTYRNTRGGSFTQPLAQVLAHVFNHQTHHRGQAHTILTGLGRKAPELDLIYFLRQR
jgi:uncharacterized damage-inducible protein DinB